MRLTDATCEKSSVERQKGLTTSHWHSQLDPFRLTMFAIRYDYFAAFDKSSAYGIALIFVSLRTWFCVQFLKRSLTLRALAFVWLPIMLSIEMSAYIILIACRIP